MNADSYSPVVYPSHTTYARQMGGEFNGGHNTHLNEYRRPDVTMHNHIQPPIRFVCVYISQS
jgi:hypothetical protein